MPQLREQQPSRHHVPIGVVAKWTLPWVSILLLLLAMPFVGFPPISYSIYVVVRAVAVVILLTLVGRALVMAWRHVGGDAHEAPWYTNGFLVAAALFWTLFPPGWFFVEYLLFEKGQITLPNGNACVSLQYDLYGCEGFLARMKTYADLASKIWAAVAVALGAAIAAARK